MTRRSWKLVTLLGIVTLLLNGMGSNAAVSAVAQTNGSGITPAATTAVLNETFEGSTMPAGWQAIGTPGWSFNNPGGRVNETGGTGNFAVADSDKAGFAVMDAELRTPALNLSAATAVHLSFKVYFRVEKDSAADVDVSLDNGATWTNIWRQTGASFNGKVTLDVPQAVGKSNVHFRFRYYKAQFSWWVEVDDVLVEAVGPPTAPSSLSAIALSNNVLLTWTDNSTDEDHFIIEQSPNGTTGWVQLAQEGPDVSGYTHADVTCGTTVFYRVKATSAALQSGYSNVDTITMPACPIVPSGINENFNAAQSLPVDWTMPSFPWVFNKPNTTGTTGNVAMAEAAGGTAVRELRTPVFSMVGASAVLLTFESDIKIFAGQTQVQDADVEISTNDGATWTVVWDKKATYKGPVSIDLSPWAANQPSLMVRFRSTLPYTGSYWQLDDVVIGAMPAPSTPTNLSATLNGGSEALLAWSGNRGSKYRLERSSNGGSTWSQIANIADGATSYVDTSVASFTPYHYRVRAYNAAGETPFSATANITTGDKTKRYIDVTISLHAGAVLTTAADRAKYENNIRYFADVLYEESNGVHLLRKVTFYRNGAHFDSSHIQWIASCRPNATGGGYIQQGTGARMEFCDVFPDSANFLADTAGQQDGGATLGHEWGHFFYGLFDEYREVGRLEGAPQQPLDSDPGDHISIMKSQFGGFADYRRFNHSAAVPGYFNLESGQGRVYGASGWETLARPKNQDPQTATAAARPYWPELAVVAPAAGVAPRIDLPNAAARASMQIVWEPGFTTGATLAQTGSHSAARAIVIDRSALMDDSGHLDAVKAAVAHMIGQTPLGDSLSIIAFDGTATVVQPLTELVDETTRDTLIAALNTITVGNAQAASGDALQLALDELTASGAPAVTSRSVYHITHGGDTSGTHAIMTVPDYESAAIPLHIFGFDPHHDDETELRHLAELTMGEYTVVRTAAELETALTHTHHDTSPHHDVTVAHAEAGLTAGQTFTAPIVFDPTLHELDFDITYLAEPISATVMLIDPLGTHNAVDPNDCDTYGSGSEAHTTCHVEYQAPVGEWTLEVQADNAMHLEYHVTGITQEGTTTYDAHLWARDGDAVTYPEPIVMYASVNRGHPIGGLQAVGQVHEADGHVFSVTFNDDGHAPDNLADDGIYSAYVDYTEPGEHRISLQFDNSAGTAFYTDKSFGDRDAVPDAPISEDFEREAHYQVSVLDWREDDHTDWPGDPQQAPTPLTVDNVQVHGRIDSAGDPDVFQVTVPNNYSEPTLSVRINSLGLGMDPDVVVFATDFAWQFEHTLDHTPTSDDSLFFAIDVQPGETFYIEVLHLNDAAETGTYSISAGPHLWSDPTSDSQSKVIYTPHLSIIRR